MRGSTCRGCLRPVSMQHAYGCAVAGAKSRAKNMESEAEAQRREERSRPRRRSVLSIASLSILGEL